MDRIMSCDSNLTNGTFSPKSHDLAELYKVITGSLIFFVILPFVILNLTVFPIGSTFAVSLGALLMVVFQVVSQGEAYHVMGHRETLTALFIMLGILIVAQYFEREQVLVKILRKLLLPSLRFENYLVRVCVLVYVISVVFSSDVCCMVLTPLLLKLWDAQERPRPELETLLIAIMTTANIGAMVTIYSSLQMALLSARTSGDLYVASRLDMRSCVMYLLPVSAILCIVNVCFLILHHRIRTRNIENSKLISEPSHSEQEMAGLTSPENPSNGQVNVINITSHGFLNGYIKASDHDPGYEGMYTQRSDERIAIPCQLETIPEDDILEISSSQSTSLRDVVDSPSPRHSPRQEYDTVTRTYSNSRHDFHSGEAVALEISDSSSSSSDEDDRMRNTDENLHQLNIAYRPGALQSQNLATESCMSLAQTPELYGLRLSQKLGIYRSVHAFTVSHFIPWCVDDRTVPGGSDSVVFLITLCVLLVTVIALLLAQAYTHIFDIGLVPLGAAILAVIADAILNRRAAVQLLQRCDWSVVLQFLALFVWIEGFHNTGLVPYVWDRFGLRATSVGAMELQTLGILCLFVMLGVHVLGPVPTVLIIGQLLDYCESQRGMVLYTAILTTAGGNMALYGTTTNLVVVQRAAHTLKYRLPYFSHLQYGLLTTLVLLPLGILLIYGLLLIGVR